MAEFCPPDPARAGAYANAAWRSAGEQELRQQIAHYLNFERGAKVDAQQIVIVSGARQAFWLCGQLLAEAGQSVVMENPGYPGARQAFSAAQLNLLPIEVDGDGIRVDKLPPAPLVYVTPSHQFPSGHLLSLARRHALIDWAQAHNAWIIEDDYDSEFHYNGAPVACMQGLDREQRTCMSAPSAKRSTPVCALVIWWCLRRWPRTLPLRVICLMAQRPR